MKLRVVKGDEDAVPEPGEIAKCLIFNQFSKCHVKLLVLNFKIAMPGVASQLDGTSDTAPALRSNACSMPDRR